MPSIANPGFSNALAIVEQVANQHEYAVFVANTQGEPDIVEAYKKRLLEMRVAGIIIALTYELARPDLVESFRKQGVPVVGLLGSRLLSGVDAFVSDNEEAGRRLGCYLAALGHRRWAYITPHDSATGAARRQGLQQAFAEIQPSPLPPAVVECPSYSANAGYQATLDLLSQGKVPECVIAFNDLMAAGVLKALQKQGMTVPDRVSLATFGDQYAAIATPALTTVVALEAEAAAMAAKRLIARIEGQNQEPAETHYVTPRLVVRESTKSPLA